MNSEVVKNEVFIDGQNLYMNTKEYGWNVDLKKFRIFLKEKWKCDKAYYFLGATDESQQDLYDESKSLVLSLNSVSTTIVWLVKRREM